MIEIDRVLSALKGVEVCLGLDIGDDKRINGEPKRIIGIYFNLSLCYFASRHHPSSWYSSFSKEISRQKTSMTFIISHEMI